MARRRVSVAEFPDAGVWPTNELPISSFDDLKTMNDAQIFGELVAVNYVKNAIDDLTKILDQSTFKHSLKEKKLSLI